MSDACASCFFFRKTSQDNMEKIFSAAESAGQSVERTPKGFRSIYKFIFGFSPKDGACLRFPPVFTSKISSESDHLYFDNSVQSSADIVSVVKSSGDFDFPRVKEHEWCGEFKKK